MLALALAIAAASLPAKTVRVVTNEGGKFKVVWKGDQAEVTRKGMFFKADSHMHLSAIKAAEEVSGCTVTNDFSPAIGVIEVALKCSNSHEARP